MLWDIKYKHIKKLEAFIELKASKLKDYGGVVCHVEKDYFKTRKQKAESSHSEVFY